MRSCRRSCLLPVPLPIAGCCGSWGVFRDVIFAFMAEPLLQISYSLAGIEEAAHRFWQYADAWKVWAIEGDMGAGKTTFLHALGAALGIEDVVSSPTFSIINEYHFLKESVDTTLYHMDWYRLRDADEARAAGAEDCLLMQDAYCAVEWPSNAPELLEGVPHLKVTIEVAEDETRRLTVFAQL